MKAIYLCGPYRGKNEWEVFLNISTARVWAEDIMRRGWAVYTPHMQTMFSGLEFDEIMRRDLEILSRMDAICLLPGWGRSEGCRMEYDFANKKGIRIFNGPGAVPYETE